MSPLDWPQFGTLETNFTVPFPEWLKDITHLNDWPADSPPYIKTKDVSLLGILGGPRYDQVNACRYSTMTCAFDCNNCLGPNDIMQCSELVQTFDDGPIQPTTSLINYFNQIQKKVSFFVVGVQLLAFPEVFRLEHSSGHFVGSHTYNHPYLPSLTNNEIAAQLQWSIWAMNATAGVIPRYFRPPYGGLDNRVRAIANRYGLTAIVWQWDTNDWKMINESRTAEQVYADVRTWKGSNSTGIILEHDLAESTVQVGIQVNKILGNSGIVAANCKDPNAPWYR